MYANKTWTTTRLLYTFHVQAIGQTKLDLYRPEHCFMVLFIAQICVHVMLTLMTNLSYSLTMMSAQLCPSSAECKHHGVVNSWVTSLVDEQKTSAAMMFVKV